MNNLYDIVQPAQKYAEVHKRTGSVLRTLLNINDVFGMSAPAYVAYARTSFGLTISEEESVKFRDRYFNLYPDIKKLHNYIWNNYKKPGFFVYTALGRPIKPKLGTDGINTPIQGSGAEVVKLAVHYLVKDNPDKPILKWIYNVVHDAIYLRIPRTEDKLDIGKRLETAMLKGWYELSKTELFKFKDIPMIAEVEYHG